MLYSNIVPRNKVRAVQQNALNIIAEALKNSFGPYGSTTGIVKDMDEKGVDINIEYTKDGHTIVKNIMFNSPIERSVQDLLTTLTRQIVKEVGDGTTSAIILCKTLFDSLCNDPDIDALSASDIIAKMNEVVEMVTERIKLKARPCTLDDIYDIALISTNNNVNEALTLRNIYEEFGMDAYIDVGISTTNNNIVKLYDGMTLEVGYCNPCFINDRANNTATINNPKIYCFQDPIDTPEMLTYLDIILRYNIYDCYANSNNMRDPVPTVILCNKITPDASSFFESTVKLMNAVKNVPLLIVSDIGSTPTEYAMFEDIAQMCGAPFIKKYIDPENQKADQERGLAPTIDNIISFCGHADAVVADSLKTKIIKPALMYDSDGSHSAQYNTMVSILEDQVQKAIDEDLGIAKISAAKRRLNSFKGNMIDYLVGGVSIADRNNLKASIEDAVLNCRSAAINGVGYAANYMGLQAIDAIYKCTPNNDELMPFINIIYDAYKDLVCILYDYNILSKEDYLTEGNSEEHYEEYVCTIEEIRSNFIYDLIANDKPKNIRTGYYDEHVSSSIRSDIVILETVSKILTLMFTCNQYLLQSYMHSTFYND